MTNNTQLQQQLNMFLIALGIRDESLRHQLTQRCLTHMVFVLPEVTPATASRIVLNQAQYFFDEALARHMGLDVIQDRNQLTVFRAQLLHQKIDTDFLFSAEGLACASLNITPEVAIPPESPLAMPKQRLTFVFRKNMPPTEIKSYD